MAEYFDVVIIGAGASGLMCAAQAGARGRRVLVIDHSPAPGRKLLITGGGRCNFTNRQVDAQNFVSQVPKFCKSAISRFTPQKFIEMLDAAEIAYGEREHGQLFCTGRADQVLKMLLKECEADNVILRCSCEVSQITRQQVEPHSTSETGSSGSDREKQAFLLTTSSGNVQCESLVIATGGVSYKETGASDFAWEIGRQFGLETVPASPGLVPLTLQPPDLQRLAKLSGIAVETLVKSGEKSFRENVLFTHRGLSGPAILQISLYWKAGADVFFDFLPDINLFEILVEARSANAMQRIKTVIAKYLPRRMVETLLDENLAEKPLTNAGNKTLQEVAQAFKAMRIIPAGTEGYRSAEVTLGGVACCEISSKTFMTHKVEGLYFIGEALDVTGWLGGYNLQWAWSSGWCAGQYV